MRCPKCHYIAFDSGERCRNCGYEFSLSVEVETPEEEPELPIRLSDTGGPLADLELRPQPPGRSSGARRQSTTRRPAGQRPRQVPDTEDLPLFLEVDQAAEAPLVRSSRTPRAPLAVRRATPARVRTADPRPPEFEGDETLGPETDPGDPESGLAPPRSRTGADLRPRATPVDRLLAGLIDLAIVAGIDAGVLYFTMRILGLPVTAVTTLPLVPFLGFLALLNGGYFVAFTVAGGQTIGKMAKHIQVVGRGGAVSFGEALARTAGYGLSALPIGLGFVAAALGPDGVALHDRLAGTRVVRCQDS